MAFTQGLKPSLILQDIAYGLKPVPFKTTALIEFSGGL